MKKFLVFGFYLLLFSCASAQEEDVVIVDDEACGCELVFVDGIQTTRSGDLFGFKRADGTVIVDNIYMFVDKFHGNYCKVFNNYEQCGLIDRNGREIIPPIYTDVSYPTEGLILVNNNGLYGFFDTAGAQAIPFTWRAASTFSNGLAVVAVDIDSELVQYGYIDHTGKMSIPPRFEYAYPFSEGYAIVQNYQRFGYIDTLGHEVLPTKYEVLSPVFHGLFFAGSIEGLALYCVKGRSISPLTKPVYSSVVDFSDGRVLVTRDSLYGFLDSLGHEVIPCQYNTAYAFFNGRATVSKDGKWGIINTLGEVVLPIEYDNSNTRSELYRFHDGFALIEKDGLYGYCGYDGHIGLSPTFEDAYHFSQGLAPVKIFSYWGYIDTTGVFFVQPVFDYASPFEYGRAEVSYHGQPHKMDLKGRCVKNCKNAPKSWRN